MKTLDEIRMRGIWPMRWPNDDDGDAVAELVGQNDSESLYAVDADCSDYDLVVVQGMDTLYGQRQRRVVRRWLRRYRPEMTEFNDMYVQQSVWM